MTDVDVMCTRKVYVPGLGGAWKTASALTDGSCKSVHTWVRVRIELRVKLRLRLRWTVRAGQIHTIGFATISELATPLGLRPST